MVYLARGVPGNGQLLSEHLGNVAKLTTEALPEWLASVGERAGLWHDLGKYVPQWQQHLIGEGPPRPHALQGARLAWEQRSDPLGPAIAYAIAGHHAGLPDRQRLHHNCQKFGDGLEQALQAARSEMAAFPSEEVPTVNLPSSRRGDASQRALLLRKEFATRMLFSALVDSDRLDALRWERKTSVPPRASEGQRQWGLNSCFNSRRSDAPENSLDALRDDFARYCIAAAEQEPGLFRLTGPCGIGKTLASLTFAVRHCERHDRLRGLIYVGPLKSIIAQSADLYRQCLGADSVLEHHSEFEPKQGEEERYLFDAERWDKPAIVTSGGQFYESLFAHSPSKCRKLHQIAGRVVLIDEAQTIPRHLAQPILDGLETLVSDWGCSVVLMSATQPAFDTLEFGQNATDIIPYERLTHYFSQLNRARFRLELDEPWNWGRIAADLERSGVAQSLIVLNTTRLAREGFQALSQRLPGEWFHLSSRMCPKHRKHTLNAIKQRGERACHLISTQMIEAGVNVDFPRGYRQLCPLDSLHHTAGRCNREGSLDPNKTEVTVFELATDSRPPAEYQDRIEKTRSLLQQDPEALGKNQLDALACYYRLVFNKQSEVGESVQKLRMKFDFPEVDRQFRVIDDDWQQSVIVPYGEGGEFIERFAQQTSLSQQDWRKLQDYIVNVPRNFINVEEFENGMRVWRGEYDSNCGVIPDT